MPYFSEPEEPLDYLHKLISDNKGVLNVKYVGYADETFLPEYPAVVVSYNVPVVRTLGPSGTFNLAWEVSLMVNHARMTTDHKTRTREDIKIASAVRELIHSDHKAGGGVIFGFVTAERPGVIQDEKGESVIATELVWAGDSRVAI